ncbi:MAG: glycosyltransferase [Sulfurospirillaceae bacterium]|nr:glycosyltransferase [Sulfurospirillaceae bacterium]
MNKKTILYIGGFELPDKNAAAQRVLSNAKIFRALGFNVVFVGIDKSLLQSTEISNTKSYVQGFETWAIPYPSNKKIWLKYITSNKHIEYIVDQYYNDDLYAVICYNYPFVAQYKVKNMCTRKNAFYIPDATEWYGSSGGGIIFNTIKWLDTSLRMRFIHPRADGLITTSKYLTDFYNNKNCTTVELPTLYDVEVLKATPPKSVNSKNIIKLMYAGSAFNLDRIDKNRTNIKDRLDKIILLLDKVSEEKSNFILNIYGLTQENYLSVFPEHADILVKLSNNMVFHGRKPHLEIIENIKDSDFTIFIREIDRVIEAGFPSKFSESISCGTPVIANTISNIEGYIVEGKNCCTISLDDNEKQVEKMLYILSLSDNERLSMKNYCLENKIFDYKEYITLVKQFLLVLEGSKHAN